MRRRLTIAFSVATVALSGTGIIGAQQATDEWFTLSKLAPHVWAAVDNPKAKQRSYSNAGFVIGDDGVVVVDTMTGDDAARRLLREIRALTGLPVRFVVNTHYHGDHVVGNRLFVDSGAQLLAHRNVRRWILPENLRMLGDKPNPEHKAFIEKLVAPNVGYLDGVDLYLGSRVAHVRSFPGHTGGDSVVIVPDAKVVFAGDLLWRGVVPNTIDGTTKAWIETLTTLATDYAGHTFVPGHGGLSLTQDVIAFRDYLATVHKLVADARATGKTGEAVTPVVLPALKEKYSAWEGFEHLAPLNIVQADAEQSGKKRIPQP
jgi:glyoxylase-like metal-dependent hydrolase (beta-lactamase superfamily II)